MIALIIAVGLLAWQLEPPSDDMTKRRGLEAQVGYAWHYETPQPDWFALTAWRGECRFAVDLDDSLPHRFFVRDDGNWEWSFYLNREPDTNVFTWPLSTHGVNVYYQPAPSILDMYQGYDMPDSVWGSYAVYHDSKRESWTYADGTAHIYRGGKMMHIYRPWCEDQRGWRVWMEMDITDSTFSLTIPNDFLANAFYPVYVDPVFGKTSSGAGTVNTGADYNMPVNWDGPRDTSGVEGVLDSIFFGVRAQVGDADFKAVAYLKNGSLGGAGLCDSTQTHTGVTTVTNLVKSTVIGVSFPSDTTITLGIQGVGGEYANVSMVAYDWGDADDTTHTYLSTGNEDMDSPGDLSGGGSFWYNGVTKKPHILTVGGYYREQGGGYIILIGRVDE
jgi:hypothetical protein